MINIKKINWSSTKISILGAGISGKSAAKLANHLNINCYLSDSNLNINISDLDEIQIELGGHSDKVLESDIIVKSPGIPNNIDIIRKAKKNNIPIISEIEFASWFSKSPIIGITGSNGKSTTVKLIHDVFQRAGYNSMLGGNFGIPFSKNVYKELSLKTPKGIHVLELSSFQLEHIEHLSLEVACILNISKDHLDRYNHFNDYIEAKFNILKTIKSNGHIIYNNDDNILNEKLSKQKKYIPFSLKDIELKTLYLDSIPLKGKHNLSNISASLAIFKIYKIDPKIIVEAISEFKPLPHRLEYLCNLKDKQAGTSTQVYNDSKSTNIKSMIVAIDTFHHSIVIIVGGLDKGKTDFYKILKGSNKKLIFVSCYGKSGKRIYNQIRHKMKSGYNQSFSKAVLEAVFYSKKSDILLLSPGCASYDQFNNFIERGDKFKEIIFGLS